MGTWKLNGFIIIVGMVASMMTRVIEYDRDDDGC